MNDLFRKLVQAVKKDILRGGDPELNLVYNECAKEFGESLIYKQDDGYYEAKPATFEIYVGKPIKAIQVTKELIKDLNEHTIGLPFDVKITSDVSMQITYFGKRWGVKIGDFIILREDNSLEVMDNETFSQIYE